MFPNSPWTRQWHNLFVICWLRHSIIFMNDIGAILVASVCPCIHATLESGGIFVIWDLFHNNLPLHCYPSLLHLHQSLELSSFLTVTKDSLLTEAETLTFEDRKKSRFSCEYHPKMIRTFSTQKKGISTEVNLEKLSSLY